MTTLTLDEERNAKKIAKRLANEMFASATKKFIEHMEGREIVLAVTPPLSP